jgi:hypothetical protein
MAAAKVSCTNVEQPSQTALNRLLWRENWHAPTLRGVLFPSKRPCRVQASQAEGRGFDPHRPLCLQEICVVVRRRDLDRLEAVTRGDAEARERHRDQEAWVCPG